MERHSHEVKDLIDSVLETLANTIEDGVFPEIGYYGSSKKNVHYSTEEGYTPTDTNPSFIDGRKAETVTPDDGTAMDDDAAANLDPFADGDVGTDQRIRPDPGVFPHKDGHDISCPY